MKLLFGLFLVFFAGFFHPQTPAALPADEDTIVVEIHYVNGETSKNTYSINEYLKLGSLLPADHKNSEVGWCTAMWSNGSTQCMYILPQLVQKPRPSLMNVLVKQVTLNFVLKIKQLH
jgi:hypothetical protein